MRSLISIIIPIYNVEAYLAKCLQSIKEQVYSNFEVLLINDGSIDESAKICLEYVDKDSRFKYLCKNNGGVSSARNLGIEKAVGEYIVFVDPDDWVSKKYLEDFIRYVLDQNIMIVQDFCMVKDGILKRKYQGYDDVEINIKTQLKLFISDYKYTQGFLWNKIFIRKIIIENELRFNVNLSLCEDEIFYLNYIKFIDKIKFIPIDNYYYNVRENSLSKKIPSLQNYYIYLLDFKLFLLFVKENINLIEYNKYYTKVMTYNFNYMLYTIILKNNRFYNKQLIDSLHTLKCFFKDDFTFIRSTNFIQKFYINLIRYDMYYILFIKNYKNVYLRFLNFYLKLRNIYRLNYHKIIPYVYYKGKYNNFFLDNSLEYIYKEEKISIERVIYCFWTGENDLTDNRKKSLEVLRKYSGVDVKLITVNNLNDYILPNFPLHPAYKYLSLVHKSDYLRCYFMYHYGGGYSDIKKNYNDWNLLFSELENSDNKMIAGYSEFDPTKMGGRGNNKKVNKDIFKYFRLCIGNGSFIFKPYSKFAAEWYQELHQRLDFYYPLLEANPGIDRGFNKGYPVPWFGILAQIIAPLSLKYNDNILYRDEFKMDLNNYL